MSASSLRAWPRRRWAVVLVAAPLLAVGYVGASGVPSAALSGWWLALGLLAGILGAAVVASYLPASGLRPDVGCTPCAAVAGLSLLAAAVAVSSYGALLAGPALAVAVTLFGLTQRLSQPATCSTPRRTSPPVS
jgi:hypothetical protein